MERIEGGATIWARKTIDSVIFYDKPDKWFKIWFFLVNRANHKEFRKWKRGECHVTYEEITQHTKASKSQIDHCIRFLKRSAMLATQKATRGMQINIINYSIYQDFNNYKSDTESELKATQKRHRSDTKNKNEKNEKNISGASAPVEVPLTGKQKDMGGFNRISDNDDDMPAIDIDSREEIETKETKIERETKELNEKIRHNLKLLEEFRGTPFGIGKDMNFHVKIYRELVHKGWSHESIAKEFMEVSESEFWKEQNTKGLYVGMNTIQSSLRNKKVT